MTSLGHLLHFDLASLGPFVLLVVAVGAVSFTITAGDHGRRTNSRLALGTSLACSLAAIVAVTLVPGAATNEHQLVPLVHIFDRLHEATGADVLLNTMGNALLYVPLGATLCLLGFSVRRTVLVAASLSALIEIAQLFVAGRTTSVDDLLLNTLGALVGHALVLRWGAGRRRPAFRFGSRYPARRIDD